MFIQDACHVIQFRVTKSTTLIFDPTSFPQDFIDTCLRSQCSIGHCTLERSANMHESCSYRFEFLLRHQLRRVEAPPIFQILHHLRALKRSREILLKCSKVIFLEGD